MEEKDIIICLKKRKKKLKQYRKNCHEAKKSQVSDKQNIFLIIQKLIVYAMIQLCTEPNSITKMKKKIKRATKK